MRRYPVSLLPLTATALLFLGAGAVAGSAKRIGPPAEAPAASPAQQIALHFKAPDAAPSGAVQAPPQAAGLPAPQVLDNCTAIRALRSVDQKLTASLFARPPPSLSNFAA